MKTLAHVIKHLTYAIVFVGLIVIFLVGTYFFPEIKLSPRHPVPPKISTDCPKV